jgi:hypothetical protein
LKLIRCPHSFAATRRSFIFYIAHPIHSIHSLDFHSGA